jgi:hypothetical protein
MDLESRLKTITTTQRGLNGDARIFNNMHPFYCRARRSGNARPKPRIGKMDFPTRLQNET